MINHHINDDICEACHEKIENLHPFLSFLFLQIRDEFPDCHISWSHRNQEQQEQMLRQGYTKLAFPKSKHNKLPSEAMDLFRLLEDDTASFDVEYYAKIAKFAYTKSKYVKWGGEFKNSDNPHFEVRNEVQNESVA